MRRFEVFLYEAAKNFVLLLKLKIFKNSKNIAVNLLSWAYPMVSLSMIWPDGNFEGKNSTIHRLR
jgi:hypothetical protein